MRLDPYALLFVLFLVALFYWKRKALLAESVEPVLYYSYLDGLKGRGLTFLERFSALPKITYLVGLCGLLAALLDPHLLIENRSKDGKNAPPKEGLAIYLVLDRSGSMGDGAYRVESQGDWVALSKFGLLKLISAQFIEGLPDDLIGVIAFARSADVVAPLTLDHAEVLKKLDKLNVIKNPAQDGTSIGYAIYKTAHLIVSAKAFQEKLGKDEKPPYEIQSALILLVTDGLQEPSPLDKGNRYRTIELEDAAEYAKENGVKVFILNVEPMIKEEKYAPNRHQMERITKATGGEFLIADHLDELPTLMHRIQMNEKNKINQGVISRRYQKVPFYPFLIGVSLLLLGLSVALKESLWRQTP